MMGCMEGCYGRGTVKLKRASVEGFNIGFLRRREGEGRRYETL